MPVFRDTTCSLCGCLCDDLVLEIEQNRFVSAEHGCSLAEQVFQQVIQETVPTARLGEHDCSLAAALDAAAGILRSSRAPLVCGFSGTTSDAQRAGIKLAEQLGAVIDSTGSKLTRAVLLAMQQVGLSTCTLGEVKQRADLVIYWGADPLKTHPRHLERYSAEPVSEFLPRGREDRTLITVGSQSTATEQAADLSLRILTGSDLHVITALRQLIRGQSIPAELHCGLTREQLQALADRMVACRYGLIFFGPAFAAGTAGHLTAEMLFRLVSELNDRTRFAAQALGSPGVENVLTWQAGFPFAVDFQQGFPRYQPGEFSAEELLERGAVDSCLLVNSDSLESLSARALAHLKSIPTIVLDAPHRRSLLPASVSVTTALPGLQVAGTMTRMDEVALPVRKLCESPYPSVESVIERLSAMLSSSGADLHLATKASQPGERETRA